MQSLKGRRVHVTLDKETLELEKRYCELIDEGKAPAQSRSEIIRSVYKTHLKAFVFAKEKPAVDIDREFKERMGGH